MSTHSIGFYEDKQNYRLIIIIYHQIRTSSLLLNGHHHFHEVHITVMYFRMSDINVTPQPLYNTIVGVQANFRVNYPNRVITRVKCIAI